MSEAGVSMAAFSDPGIQTHDFHCAIKPLAPTGFSFEWLHFRLVGSQDFILNFHILVSELSEPAHLPVQNPGAANS
jgi:hypothetical protein